MSMKYTLLAGILLATAAAPVEARPRAQIAITAEAAAAVQRSAAYLRGLSSMMLDAEIGIDTFDERGDPVHEVNRLHYEYRAPDGLFLDWSADGERRQLYSNGRSISFFLPSSTTYVTVAEGSSADGALSTALEDFAIVMPLPDFFAWAAGGESPGAFPAVRRLGSQGIDGIVTDHYAIRQNGVDFEIWIDRGARPLPRKILILAPDDPGTPRFSATLRWTVEPSLADDRFTFVPPAGARRIEWKDPSGREYEVLPPSFQPICGREESRPRAPSARRLMHCS